MQHEKLATSTRLIHADRIAGGRTGGSAPVLERSSTFALEGRAEAALLAGEELRSIDVYGRFGTGTTRLAGAMVAELEGAEAGLAVASGVAAIHGIFDSLVPPGGRIAVADDVYGGTHSLAQIDLRARAIAVDRFDARDPDSLAALFSRGAKVDLVWCESISNPLVRVTRVRELAALCGRHGALLAVDATFAAGLAQRPLALGADLVMHSATKYLNGHSDVIAGAVCGRAALVDRVFDSVKRVGACIDPMAAWLLVRGLRTLPLRFARQSETAARLARALADHPEVLRVHFPGLDPTAASAGPIDGYGAMLSFELADGARALACARAFELCFHAPSLGGLETLVCLPRRTSHTQLDAQQAAAAGITDGLVRVSVGLEDFEDLWRDFARALASG